MEPLRPISECTILIVDDEAANRDIIRQSLDLEGFKVLTAVDGVEALEMIRQHDIDLVLLDLLLPRLDGYEVCQQIKSDPQTALLPVIVITALRGLKEKIKAVGVGADDFLTKPFNHLELVTRVKSLLRVKHLSDQIKEYNRSLEQTVAERTAQLRSALADLQQLDRLKSEFIANVSHELRTPLLHVKGYIALWADGGLGEVTPEQKHSLETTQEAVERLEHLVGDIVDFGGMDVSHFYFEPVPLGTVAQQTLILMQRKMERFSGKVTVDVPTDLPLVRADRQALMRVLRHLVDNALKFSPKGGTVTLRAYLIDGGLIRVEVTDEGIGVEDSNQEKIFQSFYQVDGSTTRQFGGTGIGLALVRRLVEAHGSSIQLKSMPRKGSCFWFDLPMWDSPYSEE